MSLSKELLRMTCAGFEVEFYFMECFFVCVKQFEKTSGLLYQSRRAIIISQVDQLCIAFEEIIVLEIQLCEKQIIEQMTKSNGLPLPAYYK